MTPRSELDPIRTIDIQPESLLLLHSTHILKNFHRLLIDFYFLQSQPRLVQLYFWVLFF